MVLNTHVIPGSNHRQYLCGVAASRGHVCIHNIHTLLLHANESTGGLVYSMFGPTEMLLSSQ